MASCTRRRDAGQGAREHGTGVPRGRAFTGPRRLGASAQVRRQGCSEGGGGRPTGAVEVGARLGSAPLRPRSPLTACSPVAYLRGVMPTYEYVCTACGNAWEELQKISEPALDTCPKCAQKTAKRQISGGNFILKGGGWYADLYSSSPKKSGGGESAGGSSSSTPSTSSPSSGGDGSGASGGSSGPAKPSGGSAPPAPAKP